MSQATAKTSEPWVATNDDCEIGYLVGAPQLEPEQAVERFTALFEAEFGPVRSVDGQPLWAELRGFRNTRPGEPYDEDSLVECSPQDTPEEMVWVIEGIEWYGH